MALASLHLSALHPPRKSWLYRDSLLFCLSSTIVGFVLVMGISWYTPSVLLREEPPTAVGSAPTSPQPPPPWAGTVTPSEVVGWIGVQDRFSLTDLQMGGVLSLLKASAQFGPGHWLDDLTLYPTHVARGFTILVNARVLNERDLEALGKSLHLLFARGVRFPDELSAERHLLGSEGEQGNLIVFAIIERFGEKLRDGHNGELVLHLLKHLIGTKIRAAGGAAMIRQPSAGDRPPFSRFSRRIR